MKMTLFLIVLIHTMTAGQTPDNVGFQGIISRSNGYYRGMYHVCIEALGQSGEILSSACDSMHLSGGFLSMALPEAMFADTSVRRMRIAVDGESVGGEISIPGSPYALRADTAAAARAVTGLDSDLARKAAKRATDSLLGADSAYGYEAQAPAAAFHVDTLGNSGLGTGEQDSLSAAVVVAGGDVRLADALAGIVLTSPNGARWKIAIENGTIAAEKVNADITPLLHLLLLD